MDRLGCLSDFLEASKYDGRIGITHIGIYAALLQCRCYKGFTNPISVYSYEVMQIARISSAMTYHRCIRQLNEYGYLRYTPSFNRNKGSKVYFLLDDNPVNDANM